MKHFKVGVTYFLVLVVLVAAFFGSVYLANKAKKHAQNTETQNSNENTNSPDSLEATSPSNRPGFRVYTNLENNFSFEFPYNLTDAGDKIAYLPYVNTELKTLVSFKHEIDVQYCGASGECRPTTTDFKFGAAIVDTPLTKIKAEPGTKAEILTLGENKDVLTFSQGAEGEGIIYYFLSIAPGKTLMIYQYYIDENVLLNYKKVKEFMPFEKQKVTMREIISSLKKTK